MLAVLRPVPDIVDEIGPRCNAGERDECDEAVEDLGPVAQPAAENEGHEHEQVLDALVQPQAADELPEPCGRAGSDRKWHVRIGRRTPARPPHDRLSGLIGSPLHPLIPPADSTCNPYPRTCNASRAKLLHLTRAAWASLAAREQRIATHPQRRAQWLACRRSQAARRGRWRRRTASTEEG